MSSFPNEELIVYLWVGFLLLMLAGMAGVFWWAVRNRQFADQDRARYLPLESRIPAEPEKKPGPEPGRNDPAGPSETGKSS